MNGPTRLYNERTEMQHGVLSGRATQGARTIFPGRLCMAFAARPKIVTRQVALCRDTSRTLNCCPISSLILRTTFPVLRHTRREASNPVILIDLTNGSSLSRKFLFLPIVFDYSASSDSLEPFGFGNGSRKLVIIRYLLSSSMKQDNRGQPLRI
jgi:hypothetical protein